METTPIPDQSRLIAYVIPKKVASEKTLRFWHRLGAVLAIVAIIVLFIGIIFAMVQTFVMLTRGSWHSEYVPMIPWVTLFIVGGISLLVMILGICLEGITNDVLRRMYRYVPQGMVVKKTTRGGGETPLRWVVVVEGFNSLNQRRTDTHDVDAGYWHDECRVGDYVDYRNDEDKENSLPEALPAAYHLSEM